MALTWYNRITIAREAAGLNKSEFARAVGVSTATTSDWENGNVKSLSGDLLVKIAEVTGFNPSWIMTGKGDQKQTKEGPAMVPTGVKEPPERYQEDGGGFLTREERAMIELYRLLPEGERRRLRTIAAALGYVDDQSAGAGR